MLLETSFETKNIYNLRAGNQQLLYRCILVLSSDALSSIQAFAIQKNNAFTLTCFVLQILNRK